MEFLIEFPSKTSKTIKLKPDESEVFVIDKTGEGNITIVASGNRLQTDTYVTSINLPTVIVVSEHTTFHGFWIPGSF